MVLNATFNNISGISWLSFLLEEETKLSGKIRPVSNKRLQDMLTVALHESNTRKTIFWSEAVYNINLSSQCYLTAQIEQMQDKIHLRQL